MTPEKQAKYGSFFEQLEEAYLATENPPSLLSFYIYNIEPIDFFAALLTFPQLEEKIRRENDEEDAKYWIAQAQDLLLTAIEYSSDVGWEHTYRHEPYFGALPYSETPALYVVIKQENNGQCFVTSPLRLPWLEEEAHEWRHFNLNEGVVGADGKIRKF